VPPVKAAISVNPAAGTSAPVWAAAAIRDTAAARAPVWSATGAFLCRGNLGLLPVLHARGDRAPRLSFGHGALVGGCYLGKGLPQMSCCSSV
jgi:hypothetical protein